MKRDTHTSRRDFLGKFAFGTIGVAASGMHLPASAAGDLNILPFDKPEPWAQKSDVKIRIGIVGEYQAFFDLITNGTPASSTFQNAVNSMRVAEALEYGHAL